MTDQTPSTEDVRQVWTAWAEYGSPGLFHHAASTAEGRYAAFDAWLAAHDREVAAKALREAADHIAFEFDLDCDDVAPYGEHQVYMDNAHQYDMGQLRKRADRIEASA